MIASIVDSSFPHSWTADLLARRPMILPGRHYVYPAITEEVEKGRIGDSRAAADWATVLGYLRAGVSRRGSTHWRLVHASSRLALRGLGRLRLPD